MIKCSFIHCTKEDFENPNHLTHTAILMSRTIHLKNIKKKKAWPFKNQKWHTHAILQDKLRPVHFRDLAAFDNLGKSHYISVIILHLALVSSVLAPDRETAMKYCGWKKWVKYGPRTSFWCYFTISDEEITTNLRYFIIILRNWVEKCLHEIMV